MFTNLLMQRRATPWLILIGTVTNVAFIGLFTLVATLMAANDYDRARQSAMNFLAPAAMDLARTFESYDMSLGAVVESYTNPEVSALNDRLRRLVLFDRAATERDLGPLFVLDSSGTVVLEARPGSVEESNHWGRDYFLIHQQKPTLGLYLSRPWKAPNGEQMIALSRRINAPSGDFVGVAVGAVRLDYLRHVLSSLPLYTNDTFAISHLDGTMVMRIPFKLDLIGRDLSNSEIFQQSVSSNAGAFDAIATFDGQRRLYAFQRVGGFPLVLSHGVSLNSVYEDWWSQAAILGAIVLTLCSINIGLLFLLAHELKQRKAAEKRLASLATTDALTGLGNRRKFDGELKRVWEGAWRLQQPLALLMIDADGFKIFNDTHGHQAGDKALQLIASCISEAVTCSDCVRARYGGEEFAVLLPGQSVQEALHVARKITAIVTAERECLLIEARKEPRIPSISIGVAALVPKTSDCDVLVTLADSALYLAKKNGRNRVEVLTTTHRLAASTSSLLS